MGEPAFPLETFQRTAAEAQPGTRTFLNGHVGTGKTTTGVARLLSLLEASHGDESILVLVPQRSLGVPYLAALEAGHGGAATRVRVQTLSGLARRSIELFWPLLAEEAGFAGPDEPPVFLTIETAQYFMARAAERPLREGYFEGVRLRQNRLFSQIIDNLNKAAVVGFPHGEFGDRLAAAWSGDIAQRKAYLQAQECALLFRRHCLAHNLLDFSLQIEVFVRHLWDLPLFQEYLLGAGLHIIADNVEEDTPVAHDLLLELLPSVQSALVIYDLEGGHRTFLGADPISALRLRDACEQEVTFERPFGLSDSMIAFGGELARAMGRPAGQPTAVRHPVEAIVHRTLRYSPLVSSWAAEEIAGLIRHGTSPSEVVILAPFMSDVLRFTLEHELGQLGVPHRSHRPSRPLRDEPAARTILTLIRLAHPAWQRIPLAAEDVGLALMHAIDGMDLVRARLLTDAVLHREERGKLLEFAKVPPALQTRITFLLGERYEKLRAWLESYQEGPAAGLDHFIGRLFGEVLSQRGFGFHRSLDAGQTTAVLIESVRKFRAVAGGGSTTAGIPLGLEYISMVDAGLLAAAYSQAPLEEDQPTVLLSPAFTFLMRNHPVDYQFWLDVNSDDWSRRIYQPLTHPYVLSRQWEGERPWSDEDEKTVNEVSLARLTQGLVRRCRKQIYLGFSDIGPHGWEERGPLMRAINKVLVQERSA